MTQIPAIQQDKQNKQEPASAALPTYEQRVDQLINEGLTNSDAQAIADMEAEQGLLSTNGIFPNL